MIDICGFTIATKAYITVPPGDNIYTDYGTATTKGFCAPGPIEIFFLH